MIEPTTELEVELRDNLRTLLGTFARATEAELPVYAIVLEELHAAGVELPPALTMLFGSDDAA